jgi:hypothetical protein
VAAAFFCPPLEISFEYADLNPAIQKLVACRIKVPDKNKPNAAQPAEAVCQQVLEPTSR